MHRNPPSATSCHPQQWSETMMIHKVSAVRIYRSLQSDEKRVNEGVIADTLFVNEEGVTWEVEWLGGGFAPQSLKLVIFRASSVLIQVSQSAPAARLYENVDKYPLKFHANLSRISRRSEEENAIRCALLCTNIRSWVRENWFKVGGANSQFRWNETTAQEGRMQWSVMCFIYVRNYG